jgi:thioredoxin-related protein
MRYIFLVFALLSALNAFEWPNNYDEALAKAKKEKKDVYLFLGSEYCRYCDKFKKEVLEKDEILKKLHKSYVLLYLSRDIDDIPPRFEVKPVPRHYFLTNDGKIIYTTIGGRSVKSFDELLDEVADSKNN